MSLRPRSSSSPAARRVALALTASALLAVVTVPVASAAGVGSRSTGSAAQTATGAAALTSGSRTLGLTSTRGGRTVVSPAPAPTADPAVAEVVRLVNVERAKVAGCPALRVDARLATAARLHSEDMARQNYFSHTSLDGRSPWDRIAAQGYTGATGENIAAGYQTPASVMTGWMNSSGHRANILNCTSRAIGVGIGYGGSYGIYWTQTFGRV